MYGAALSRGFGFADCARRLLRVLGARRLPRILGAIACNKSESTVYLAVLCPRATPSGGLFNTCIRRMTRLFASSVHDASPLDFLHSTNFWMELTSPQFLLKLQYLICVNIYIIRLM